MYFFFHPSSLCRGFQWNFLPSPPSSFFNCILESIYLDHTMYNGYILFNDSRTLSLANLMSAEKWGTNTFIISVNAWQKTD